jgi:hypothetical protein
MNRTAIAKPNQSLLDIIVTEYGTLEAGMLMAWETGLSISTFPSPGSEIEIPTLPANGILTDDTARSYLKQNSIVIGTKGIAEPLTMTVVLKPRMQVVPNIAAPPHVIGYYSYDFEAAADFINSYELVDSYLSTNDVHYETEELYVTGVPYQTGTQLYVAPMTAKSIPYQLAWTVGFGYMMVWSPPAAPISTATFKDVEGNIAIVSPLIILNNVSQDLILYLIADIDVEVISSTSSDITLRLVRHHAPSYVPDFNNFTMSWLEAALDAIPDPADPSNDDVRILTVFPGNYTIGVETSYQHAFGYVFPSSTFTMVINVG